jgi:hypothetical protein
MTLAQTPCVLTEQVYFVKVLPVCAPGKHSMISVEILFALELGLAIAPALLTQLQLHVESRSSGVAEELAEPVRYPIALVQIPQP